MTQRKQIEEKSMTGYAKIHLAAEKGDIETLKRLLNEGHDINQPTKGEGYTPVMLAAQENKIDAVRLLIENGASLLRTNDYNQRAYDISCKTGNNPQLIAFIREETIRQEEYSRGLTQKEMVSLIAFKTVVEEYFKNTNRESQLKYLQQSAKERQPEIARQFWAERSRYQ